MARTVTEWTKVLEGTTGRPEKFRSFDLRSWDGVESMSLGNDPSGFWRCWGPISRENGLLFGGVLDPISAENGLLLSLSGGS